MLLVLVLVVAAAKLSLNPTVGADVAPVAAESAFAPPNERPAPAAPDNAACEEDGVAVTPANEKLPVDPDAGTDAARAVAGAPPATPPNENPDVAGGADAAVAPPKLKEAVATGPLAVALATEAPVLKLNPEAGAGAGATPPPNPKPGTTAGFGALASELNPEAGAEAPLVTGAAALPKENPEDAAGVDAAAVAVPLNPPNAGGAPLVAPAPGNVKPVEAVVIAAAGAPNVVAEVLLAPKPPNAGPPDAALPPLPKLGVTVEVPAPNAELDAAAEVKAGVEAAPADLKACAGAAPCLCLLAM